MTMPREAHYGGGLYVRIPNRLFDRLEAVARSRRETPGEVRRERAGAATLGAVAREAIEAGIAALEAAEAERVAACEQRAAAVAASPKRRRRR